MHVIVCVKQAVDVDQVKIDPQTLEPITFPTKLDDLSKNALEEAVRIKERFGGKVTVIVVGDKVSGVVKEALAIGGDEAKVVTVRELIDTESTALTIAEIVRKIEDFDLLLFGEASIDTHTSQVGPRVAEILKLPILTFVRKIEKIDVESRKIVVLRDLEEWFERVEASMPAVLTVTNEINEPRLPSLSQILKAAKKPVETFEASELGVRIGSNIEVLRNKAPRIDRKKRIYKEDVDGAVNEIVSELIKEGIL